MTEHTTDLLWTHTLIHELITHGISYFCISPGSRSTPLVLAISAHPQAESFLHFDERALGFHALGYAKAFKKPAAIVVTSGTATGNLLPTIMEAHESAIPLIILTADRPSELQECGANQTTLQTHMFQNYVRWQHTIPTPTPVISIDYIKTTIGYACAKATLHHKGPVHLNCAFREPFSHSLIEEHTRSPIPKTRLLPSIPMLEDKYLADIASLLQTTKKGMIVLGYEALEESDLTYFYQLADLLHWPILCDPLSKGQNHPCAIAHYDLTWDLLTDTHTPECILHFGGAFVSKHLITFLKHIKPTNYIHSLPYEKRQDPMHLITHRLFLSPSTLCQQLLPWLKPNLDPDYFFAWYTLDSSIKESLEEVFARSESLNEPQLAHHLSLYDLSNYAVFVSSSMPIRDMTQFFHPKISPKRIYGNRGLSGIDGNIATTIGLAKALSSPMIAILGDQTFLHDLTSLSQLQHLLHPVIFLIINNGGGSIFSFLPIYKQKELCNTYFINTHNITFAHAAALFQLQYRTCDSLDEFTHSFSNALNASCHQLIEIKTHRETNLEMHQIIKKELLKYAQYPLLRR